MTETEQRERVVAADLSEALTMTGCRDVADLIDMANVGRSMMDRMAEATAEGPLKGWAPADDPAEIVTDLKNALDDALHDYGNAESECKVAEAALEEAKADRDHWKGLADEHALFDAETDLAFKDLDAQIETLTADLSALQQENERLRLLILGGEDVPGVAASLPFDEVAKAHRDHIDQLRAYASIAEAKSDMLADSNYLAGVTAGWNAAQDGNPNEALAKIQNSRKGHIGAYRAALSRKDQAG